MRRDNFIESTTLRLTLKRLAAIEEALIFRFAGEIEDGDESIPHADYETALEWVGAEIERHAAKR